MLKACRPICSTQGSAIGSTTGQFFSALFIVEGCNILQVCTAKTQPNMCFHMFCSFISFNSFKN